MSKQNSKVVLSKLVKGTCSFCLSKNKRVVQGNGVAICPTCVADGIEKITPKEGSIICPKCEQETPSFLLTFSSGAQMIFVAVGMNETDTYIYKLTATSGLWSPSSTLYKAVCRVCDSTLNNIEVLKNEHCRNILTPKS